MGFLKKIPNPKGLEKLTGGYTTTMLAGATAFVGFGASSGISNIASVRDAETTGYSSYYGNMQDFAYDAQGQVDRKSGDKSLGATGDLVFGLNASKHGRR